MGTRELDEHDAAGRDREGVRALQNQTPLKCTGDENTHSGGERTLHFDYELLSIN